MSTIAKLDTSRLDQLLNEAIPQKAELLNTIAHDIEGLAKDRAPVKTGNLKANIKAEQVDDDTWRINCWAPYSLYVEVGTYKMAARPYLIPAAEQAMKAYVELWRRFFS